LDLVNPKSLLEKATSGSWHESWSKQTRGLRTHALLNGALVFTTVISGAYVAGNDAGKAYGDFPLMAGKWIPDGILEMNPVWRNFFENTATVQFDHRILALTTLGSITAMYSRVFQSVESLQGGKVSLLSVLPKRIAVGCHASIAVAVAQVGLGITTLVLVVPVPLAATHQVCICMYVCIFICMYIIISLFRMITLLLIALNNYAYLSYMYI